MRYFFDNFDLINDKAAPKLLKSFIGSHNDTWFVGQIPVGFLKKENKSDSTVKTGY
jgi:hypothetical protein